PTTEAIDTIRPCRRRTIPRKAARVRRKVAVRLTSSTACQSSSRKRSASESRVMPALLTRMSSWPSAASASLTSASAASGVERSAVSTGVPAPSSAASASSAGRRVPARATIAPARCRARAIAPPIPPEAPVTSAACPPRSNMASEPLHQFFGLGRAAGRHYGHLAVDPPAEAGQHLAGADLDDLLNLVEPEQEDRLAPAHHAGDLLDEERPDHIDVLGGCCADVGD